MASAKSGYIFWPELDFAGFWKKWPDFGFAGAGTEIQCIPTEK